MSGLVSRRAVLGLVATTPSLAFSEPILPSVTVIGDSHGIGMARSIHEMRPDWTLNNKAVGGSGSWQMPIAPDDGSLVILSAGTVDCCSRDPDDKMVDSILRILGPFLEGKQSKGGKLAYVLPHDRTRISCLVLNPRIRKLNQMISDSLDWEHSGEGYSYIVVPIIEDPGEDGLHLTRKGYKSLASRALSGLGIQL
jgi:hypothetical protein